MNNKTIPDSVTTHYLMTKAEINERWPDMKYNGINVSFSPLTLNQYQKEANKNKAFPEKYAVIYPTIGLLNEAGEMAGKIKKWMRGDVSKLNIEDVRSEMGDVLWYLSSLASDLNITLEEVALDNIKKITSRREKNMIKGDGDHREKEIKPPVIDHYRQTFPSKFEGDIIDPNKIENDKIKAEYLRHKPFTMYGKDECGF